MEMTDKGKYRVSGDQLRKEKIKRYQIMAIGWPAEREIAQERRGGFE